MPFDVLNVHSLYSQQQQCNKLRLMTRLQKNVSVFQGGQMTPLPLPVGAHEHGRQCLSGRVLLAFTRWRDRYAANHAP